MNTISILFISKTMHQKPIPSLKEDNADVLLFHLLMLFTSRHNDQQKVAYMLFCTISVRYNSVSNSLFLSLRQQLKKEISLPRTYWICSTTTKF